MREAWSLGTAGTGAGRDPVPTWWLCQATRGETRNQHRILEEGSPADMERRPSGQSTMSPGSLVLLVSSPPNVGLLGLLAAMASLFALLIFLCTRWLALRSLCLLLGQWLSLTSSVPEPLS